MLELIRRVGIRNLVEKRLRTALTLVAITLGIGLWVSISIINRSVLASFRESVAALAGKAVLTVAAGDAGFAEERIEDITKVPGVKSAIPRVAAWGYLAGPGDASETIYILGIDMLREQSVRSYNSGSGEILDDPLVFLNEPDSVILTKDFAAAHGLARDSVFELATTKGKISLHVRGLLEPEGPAKAYGGAIAIMDIDGARLTLGRDGLTDAIDIVPRPGVEKAALQQSLRAALGPGFTVEPPEGTANQLESLVQSFQALLSFFGTIALIVGLFLVANSMSMSITERQKEIGVLRALGATRGQIFGLLIGEAALLGAVGSLAGAFLGRALASIMVKDVAEAMSTQFVMKVTITSLEFDKGTVLRTFAVGVTTAAIAAFVPVLRATRIAPTVAMRAQAGSEDMNRSSRLSEYVGIGLLAFVLGTIAVPSLGQNAGVQSAAQMAAIIGAALVSPSLVRILVSGVRRLLAGRRDVVARLATENLLRYRKRTRTNVIGLTLGLLLVMLISGLSHSFKKSLLDWVIVQFRSDLIVSSRGTLVKNLTQPLHEDVGVEIQTVPGLRRTHVDFDGIRLARTEYEGRQIAVKAFSEPLPEMHYWQWVVLDRTRDEAGAAVFHAAEPSVLVSSNFVLHFGKKPGDAITMNTPTGPATFRIAGLVTDFASPEGVVYLARDRYKKLWRDPTVSGFGLFYEPGVDRAKVRRDLESRFGREKNLVVVANEEMRVQFRELIDKSFAGADALESAALLIALIGIFNTLMIGILERTRELGMMRAIGMERGQLARMVLVEAGLTGAATALVAVALGGALGYWLITISLPTTLGWVLNYSMPLATTLLVFVTGLLVAILAGVYPAWRASRVAIVDALSHE
jgi:putative ABC transport system permease protein